VFRLTEEDATTEGPIFMWIAVQKKFGIIYATQVDVTDTW